jgi:hypothetical protein
MKELLTKKFWRDVKKTFDEARNESPDSGSEAASLSEANPTGSPVKDPPPREATHPSD